MQKKKRKDAAAGYWDFVFFPLSFLLHIKVCSHYISTHLCVSRCKQMRSCFTYKKIWYFMKSLCNKNLHTMNYFGFLFISLNPGLTVVPFNRVSFNKSPLYLQIYMCTFQQRFTSNGKLVLTKSSIAFCKVMGMPRRRASILLDDVKTCSCLVRY